MTVGPRLAFRPRFAYVRGAPEAPQSLPAQPALRGDFP